MDKDKMICPYCGYVRHTGQQRSEQDRLEWVKVEDRLPEKNGDYLVYIVHDEYCGCEVAFFRNVEAGGINYSFFEISGGIDENNEHITHWMALPDPPDDIEEKYAPYQDDLQIKSWQEETEKLRKEADIAMANLKQVIDCNNRLREQNNELIDALKRIKTFADAYPTSVFLELSKADWRTIADILESHGFTLDAISASNARLILSEIAKIIDPILIPMLIKKDGER